uniref:Uncharacterized protein n=1 Tax=Xenopus tropicalis TaxID=8364 RepID=A0A1B8YAR4_XENTR
MAAEGTKRYQQAVLTCFGQRWQQRAHRGISRLCLLALARDSSREHTEVSAGCAYWLWPEMAAESM